MGTLFDVIFEDFDTVGVSGAAGDLEVASRGRFVKLLDSFGFHFGSILALFGGRLAQGTVLPLVRESYFHSLSVCKEMFFDSTLSVPALGDTFCRFVTLLGSRWVPGGTLLVPWGLSFDTLVLSCFLMPK